MKWKIRLNGGISFGLFKERSPDDDFQGRCVVESKFRGFGGICSRIGKRNAERGKPHSVRAYDICYPMLY